MLKTLKCGVLHTLKAAGAFRIVRNSRWRQQRLLILCYHGISLDDEHQWEANLFMTPAAFDQRLTVLRKYGCTVLPLGEALERLGRNDLPPNATVLTFDDGTYDFYAKAYPILKAHGMTATVYLTTYYSEYNKPVFDVACAYVLWKGRGAVVEGREFGLPQLDLTTPASRDAARRSLLALAKDKALDAGAKDALLQQLAQAVKFDYAELVRKKLLHIMTAGEVRELSAAGIDFQLHTHRHRTPLDRELFLREIRDNRQSLRSLTGRDPVHFCYPSGVYRPEFLPWLSEESVVSATTCEPGLASSACNRLLLPRLVDHPGLNPIEFESWIAGCSAFLPHRAKPSVRPV